jgi:hypothetical protein
MSETLGAVACAALSALSLARLQSAEDSGHYNFDEATT